MIVGLSASATASIAALLTAVVWVDSRYAHAEDVQQAQLTSEQSLLLIQQEVTEDKIWRMRRRAEEENRPLTTAEQQQIEKLLKRQARIEKRYDRIDEKLLEKK